MTVHITNEQRSLAYSVKHTHSLKSRREGRPAVHMSIMELGII